MSLEQLQFIKWKAIYFPQESSLLPVSFNVSSVHCILSPSSCCQLIRAFSVCTGGKKTCSLERHFHCLMLLCVCSTDISVKLFGGFILQPRPFGVSPSSFFLTRLCSVIWWDTGIVWSSKTAATSQKFP